MGATRISGTIQRDLRSGAIRLNPAEHSFDLLPPTRASLPCAGCFVYVCDAPSGNVQREAVPVLHWMVPFLVMGAFPVVRLVLDWMVPVSRCTIFVFGSKGRAVRQSRKMRPHTW